MRHQFILLVTLTLISAQLSGQEIDNINPRIKIVTGEPFYIHEVQKGQSLEAIARAYASTIVAIEEENPSLTDPLIVGINIRIPYTDESAARMMEIAQEMGLQASEEQRERMERERNARLKKQAAELLPSKLAKPPTEDEKAPEGELTDKPAEVPEEPEEEVTSEEQLLLKELTDNVSKGLKELEEVEKEIEETPYLDKDGLPKKEQPKLKEPTVKVEPKGTSLTDLIDETVDGFKVGDSLSYLSDLFMREYFLVRVNPEGVITNVRDERTLTNANTRVLKLEQLKGRYLIDDSEEFALQIVPVGVNVSLKRYRYPAKLKYGKVKPLKPSITEDELDPDGDHFDFISSNEQVMQLKGKYVIELVEGSHFLSIHDQFEYNPFGVTLEEVGKGKILEVVAVEER